MRHAACRLGLSLLASLVVAVPAAAAAPARGAVHLEPGAFKRVAGAKILCGRIDGRWQAGTRQRAYWFLSHAQHAANLRRAGHAARARSVRRRAVAERPACQPLRFNLRGASGVAVHGRARPRAGDLSNLDVVRRNGTVRDAITAGTANVERIFTAPGGKVYALFTGRTAIGGGEPIPGTETGCEEENEEYTDDEDAELRSAEDEEEYHDEEEECVPEPEYTPTIYCVLAELDPVGREPTCIDGGLWSVRASTFRGANEAVQFDAQGAVYFMGWAETFVLRRYHDGKTTDLVSDRNVLVDDYLVLGDGDVLVSGASVATGARWLRRIEPAGRVHSVWSRSASFLRLFPDGNAYVGHDTAGAPGVQRFLTASDAMDTTAWITRASADELCADADQGAIDAFCTPAGSRISESVTTPDGRVYAVAGAPDGGRLVRYFPDVALPASAVRKVSVAELVGDDVALAGVDASEHRVLALHDTQTDDETLLIGPDAELDVYHLAYDAKANTLRFDGLRFADNRYVLGSVDLATGTVSYQESSTTQWTDLEAVG